MDWGTRAAVLVSEHACPRRSGFLDLEVALPCWVMVSSSRPRRDQDLDDWFAEPDPPTPHGAPSSAPSPDMFEAPTVESQVSGAENWLSDETAPTRRPRFRRADFSPRQRAVATGAVALVFVLVGLAAAGVFSGGSRPRTQVTSTLPRTTAPVSTPTAATTPAPATTLKAGSSGPQVRTLQRALVSLGYSPGSIDGQYGTGTERALARFQQAHNLAADGVLGPATLAALTNALNNRG